MAVRDTKFTNGAGTTLDVHNKSTYFAGLPQGILNVLSDVIFADIPRKTPVGVYLVNNMKTRRIVLPIICRGTTASAQMTNVRAAVAHFAQCIRDEQDGVLDFTAENAVRRLIRAAVKDIDIQNDPAGEPDQVVVTLEAGDPSFYGPTLVENDDVFNDDTPVAISLVHPGDWPAYPVITYTGAVQKPQVTDGYGNVMKIDDELEAGDELVITIEPRSFSIIYTEAGGSPVSWYAKRIGDIPFVRPGTHNLTFVADTTGDADIKVEFYPRYSSHG